MSKDINYTKILTKLDEIHTEFEDLRFGQVLQNAIDTSKKKTNIDLHYLNSKKILTALEEFHNKTKKARGVDNG